MTMPDGTSVGGPTVAEKLQNGLKLLAIATVFLYLVTIGLGIGGFLYIRGYAQEGRDLSIQTTGALCALKFDFQQRIDQNKQFLEDNPNGIPGITPAVIQQQIDNTQRTLDALSTIECPPTPGG